MLPTSDAGASRIATPLMCLDQSRCSSAMSFSARSCVVISPTRLSSPDVLCIFSNLRLSSPWAMGSKIKLMSGTAKVKYRESSIVALVSSMAVE